MRINLKDLTKVISRLPNPETYNCDEYHAIILEPPSLYPCYDKIPQKSNNREFVFKKQFSEGKYEWYLEC